MVGVILCRGREAFRERSEVQPMITNSARALTYGDRLTLPFLANMVACFVHCALLCGLWSALDNGSEYHYLTFGR